MSKIKCSSCGKEIDSESNFCSYCGNKINKQSGLMDKLINLFRFDKTPKQFYERFLNVKDEIEKFNEELHNFDYVDKSLKSKLKKNNNSNFSLCINLERNHNSGKLKLNSDELKLVKSFIENYENIDKIVRDINKKHIDKVYDKFKQEKTRYKSVIDKYNDNICYDELITEHKNDLKKDYIFIRDLLAYEKSDGYDFGKDSQLMKDFIEIYNNFYKIKNEINDEISRRKKIVDDFNNNQTNILVFIDKFRKDVPEDLYIDKYRSVLNDFKNQYDICAELSKLPEKYHTDVMGEFLDIYDNFKEISKKINEDYIERKYKIFSDKKAEIKSQLTRYETLTVDVYLENKDDFLVNYLQIHEILDELKDKEYSFNQSDLEIVNNFQKLFNNFNGEFPKITYSLFSNYKHLLSKFLNRYGHGVRCDEYIFEKDDILNEYSNTYEKTLDIFKLNEAHELDISDYELNSTINFIDLYENFDEYITENNECYVKLINDEFSDCKDAILEFIAEYNSNNLLDYYIEDINKPQILKSNEKYYDLVNEMNSIPETANDAASHFIRVYDNFDEIVFHMNKNYVNNLYRINEENIAVYVSIMNLKQNYYISNSKLNELICDYNYCSDIVLKLLEYCSNYEYLSDKSKLLQFPKSSDELVNIVQDANDAFIERELCDNKTLFDSVVPGKPLDDNQRKAVVIDEDNTQIIAGAGCGKTLTLQAKAKYLIDVKNVDPSEILAISFSNFSADDLERKMLEIGLNIDVSTFHALGLDILRNNNVKAKVDEYALKNAIKKYFVVNLIDNDEMLQKIVEYFGYFMYEPLDKNEIDNIGEVYDYERGMDLETLYWKLEKLRDPTLKKTSLKGERVKSLEERKIANFLFINGVNYTYEKEYEPKIDWKKTHDYLDRVILSDIEVPKPIKDDLITEILEYLELDEHIYWANTGEELVKYHPDFYLDDYDIYYEHFGVNRDCIAPWLPKAKRRQYKREMRNKRILHKNYGTTLIETYSYYQSENRLLERLGEKLQEKGVKFKKFDYQRFMIDLLHDEEKINEYWDFIKLVETFINLFKGNGYQKEKFNEFRKINNEKFTGFEKQKHEMFLDIVEDIYDYYYKYLKNHKIIDFNDMINDATEKVKTNGYYKNYKYILVDEFQDTSHTRFNFLKAIKDELNAKLIVVGDDWQSIYRFTGCDIDLFTDFENYFDNSKTEICYITNTYRNSQSLIDVSGNFVMKNDAQFKKQLNSKSNIQLEDTIKLYQYLNFIEQPFVFEAIICDIYDSSDDDYVNILVLGRNRKDFLRVINEELFFTTGTIEDKNLKIHYRKNPNISIRYMTVHGSKGLEEENVVLINLEDKKNGFPNKIEDDSVLSFVKNEKIEPIEFAEERRLFYVALTRTLKRTYLLAPKDKKSIFVTELMDDIEVIDFSLPEDDANFGDEIRTIASTDGICPDCGTGKINLKFNPKTGKRFFKCSNWPRCDWYGGNFYDSVEQLDNPKYCPKCGGLLVRKINGQTGEQFYSCINYFPNKSCKYTEDIL